VYGITIRYDPTFIDGVDGLAQVRRALYSVPGVLAGYHSDDREAHTYAAPIHSVERQLMINTGCHSAVVHFLCDVGKT
jgi:hypothetical protein